MNEDVHGFVEALTNHFRRTLRLFLREISQVAVFGSALRWLRISPAYGK